MSIIVKENVEEVLKCGLNIRGVVSDQGGPNVLCYNILREPNPAQNYFFVNGKRIYLFEDYCHIIKNLRNSLHNHDIQTPFGIASWEVVREFFEIDKSGGNVRLAPKLTSSHIDPNFYEIMRVKLAVQVCSHTTSSAIKMCSEQNLFKVGNNEINAMATARFLEEVNNVFDLLNSHSLNSGNPNNRPITKTNYTV